MGFSNFPGYGSYSEYIVLKDIDLVFNASPVRDEGVRLKSVEVTKEGGIFVCTHLDQPFSDEFLNALIRKNATGTMIGGGSGVPFKY